MAAEEKLSDVSTMKGLFLVVLALVVATLATSGIKKMWNKHKGIEE